MPSCDRPSLTGFDFEIFWLSEGSKRPHPSISGEPLRQQRRCALVGAIIVLQRGVARERHFASTWRHFFLSISLVSGSTTSGGEETQEEEEEERVCPSVCWLCWLYPLALSCLRIASVWLSVLLVHSIIRVLYGPIIHSIWTFDVYFVSLVRIVYKMHGLVG